MLLLLPSHVREVDVLIIGETELLLVIVIGGPEVARHLTEEAGKKTRRKKMITITKKRENKNKIESC